MNSKYLEINQEKLEILTEYLGENYQKKGREAGLSSMMHHNGTYYIFF